ncbi:MULTISPECIES: hypothetical protein [Pantoea]|jgi:hypothetical protein|nr:MULTISPECIES: hypothetical protein [Pantoea]
MKSEQKAEQYQKQQETWDRQRAELLKRSNGFTFINAFLQRLIMGERK